MDAHCWVLRERAVVCLSCCGLVGWVRGVCCLMVVLLLAASYRIPVGVGVVVGGVWLFFEKCIVDASILIVLW